MQALWLEVDFRGYWHAGTGCGSGHHLDALVCRDASGLPYLPGKTLRGLLRDAMHRLEAWGVEERLVPKGTTRRLFGGEALEAVARGGPEPGALFVSDARLPEEVRAWLGRPEQAALRRGLFRTHFSTAMTPEGVARARSLRGMELAVPLVLEAEVRPLPGHEAQLWREAQGWREAILAALPLVRSAGAMRSRGLGRCVIREAGRG